MPHDADASRSNPGAAAALDPESLRPIFEGKSIFVGVTGGIAAYKTCTLVSRIAQAGARVTVAMTEAAARFVGPITFQALSANHVYTSAWEHVQSQDPQHISLATNADACIVAPCTMDCMARLASGMTSDVVCLILSAVDRSKTPVLLAPAMNTAMWAQPATQRNAKQLVDDGYTLVGPGDGWQACRHVGAGRMSEPEQLVAALADALRARN